MKLCYRGVSYESNFPTIDSIETGVIAIFRGQTYQIRRPLLEAYFQPHMDLKYRGVAYALNEFPTIKVQISLQKNGINPALR